MGDKLQQGTRKRRTCTHRRWAISQNKRHLASALHGSGNSAAKSFIILSVKTQILTSQRLASSLAEYLSMHDPKVIPVTRILLDPQDIQQFLPRIVENLSLHRGLRLADEIHACIAGRKPDELLSIIVHAEHDPSLILATAILSIPTPTEVCHPISPDEHRKPNPPDTQPIRQAALPVRRLAEVLHAASFPNTSDDLISHASQLSRTESSQNYSEKIQQIRWIRQQGYPTQLGLMHLSTVNICDQWGDGITKTQVAKILIPAIQTTNAFLTGNLSPSRPHLHLQPVSRDSKEGLVGTLDVEKITG